MLEKTAIMEAFSRVEYAASQLRRQQGIVIAEKGGPAIAHYPVEFTEALLYAALSTAQPMLLLTGARAQTLGLPAHDLKVDASALSLSQVRALADPLSDTVALPPLAHWQASATESLALRLAKHAGVLPALLLVQAAGKASPLFAVDAKEVDAFIHQVQSEVIQTACAALPIEGAEKAALFSFRARHGSEVHLALVIGELTPDEPPLVRVHSSCVTGDILGSLRCDCGNQLALALNQLCKAGSGILVYLYQEGRGIGITNKLRSYALQERGIDTFTANLMLGFGEDERDFSVAAAILRALGAQRVQLLTNNPQKLSAMEKAGIDVAKRVPLVSPAGAHNHAYIKAKAHKAGHLF